VIGDLAADIDERKGDSGERDKYELLFKRDQEMTEFIDRFEETREKEVRCRAREASIVLYRCTALYCAALLCRFSVSTSVRCESPPDCRP